MEHLFQYQLVWSRSFRKSNSSTFKDLQTQIQGLSRTRKNPVRRNTQTPTEFQD